jgi:hypothetical protein
MYTVYACVCVCVSVCACACARMYSAETSNESILTVETPPHFPLPFAGPRGNEKKDSIPAPRGCTERRPGHTAHMHTSSGTFAISVGNSFDKRQLFPPH